MNFISTSDRLRSIGTPRRSRHMPNTKRRNLFSGDLNESSVFCAFVSASCQPSRYMTAAPVSEVLLPPFRLGIQHISFIAFTMSSFKVCTSVCLRPAVMYLASVPSGKKSILFCLNCTICSSVSSVPIRARNDLTNCSTSSTLSDCIVSIASSSGSTFSNAPMRSTLRGYSIRATSLCSIALCSAISQREPVTRK